MTARTNTAPPDAASAGSFTGGREAADIYDRAVDRLLRFHPDVVGLATTLTAEHADAPMGQALTAYLCLMSTDRADLPTALEAQAALAAAPTLTPREEAHRQAVTAWSAGDWNGAARTLDDLLVRWPTDLVALAMGHQLDFFLGDAAELRDRPGRTLARLDPEHPHTGFVRGMQSFGLEESGHYELAEDAGLAAVATNPDDVWGIHAIAHTYEMQGRVDDGIRFMQARRAHWGEGNLFTVHNWWHLALYHLEAGRHEDVLRLYDERVHHAGSAGVALELLDASALLLRLVLDGVDTGARFGPLADAWAAALPDEPWYSFNDFHAAIAFAGAGRLDDARAVVSRMERLVARGPDVGRTNVTMTGEVALPLSIAVIALFEDRPDEAFRLVHPIRRILARFGGSHAQRDLPARMLVESAIRSGRAEVARALVDERLAVRPSNTFAWSRLATLAEAVGDTALAEAATTACDTHRGRFAAAAVAT